MIVGIGLTMILCGIALYFKGVFSFDLPAMIAGGAFAFAGGMMCFTRLIEVLI